MERKFQFHPFHFIYSGDLAPHASLTAGLKPHRRENAVSRTEMYYLNHFGVFLIQTV